MNKSFKESIDARLSSITPFDDLSARIKQRAYSTQRNAIRFNFRRVVAIAATICLLASLSVGVMAASLPQLNTLFALVGQNVYSLLQPVVQKTESNGIAMEVLAAVNDDDSVFIYLTLQDLQGDRLDETLKLYNFEVDDVFAPHAEVIFYDEATHTATMRISGIGGENLDGKKISIKLKSILSNYERIPLTDTGITLEHIMQENSTPQIFSPNKRSAWESNFPASSLSDEIALKLDGKMMSLLKQEQKIFKSPLCDWTYISGYGIIDDVLHIQQNPDSKSGRYNKLDFELGDENNMPYAQAYKTTVSFGQNTVEGIYNYSDYSEDAILIPSDIDYSKAKILASATTYEQCIEGEWNATFKLESANEIKTANCIINMNPWEITDISVSAVGVTVKGCGKMYEYSYSPNIKVLKYDGTYVKCDTAFMSFASEEDGTESIIMKNTFALPIDVKDIASVSINDKIIAVK